MSQRKERYWGDIVMESGDWGVVVLDGEPELTVGIVGVAALVKSSPVGVEEAIRRLKLARQPDGSPSFTAEHIRTITELVEKTDD